MSNRILLVDDDHDICSMMASLLRLHGFEVESADCGRAALVRLTQPDLPDVVLLDVTMPDMSGFEVLRRIKGDPATTALPVVMVTAQASDEALMNGYQDGADYYVTKPCSAGQLLYGIHLVLGERYPQAVAGEPLQAA
jgi:two-component system, OmpR family, alkaline phosphatase synthesis response regulator PhoP